ncbi:hypothetical protein Esti_003527 [Eimeria stiedai]
MMLIPMCGQRVQLAPHDPSHRKRHLLHHELEASGEQREQTDEDQTDGEELLQLIEAALDWGKAFAEEGGGQCLQARLHTGRAKPNHKLNSSYVTAAHSGRVMANTFDHHSPTDNIHLRDTRLEQFRKSFSTHANG